MKHVEMLQVWIGERQVGTLAMTVGQKVAFQYMPSWLEEGYSINPFSLPLNDSVFLPQNRNFGGLFGAFADSLPDAWGRLLLTRLLRKKGISEDQISSLDRLAIIGASGMGALEYRPALELSEEHVTPDLDTLVDECRQILTTEYDAEHLEELYRLGGSSGGARPKILTEIDGKPWIIKFPAHVDRTDAGKMEFDYMECAEQCGIQVPKHRLFSTPSGNRFFGVRRFDRPDEGKRLHMLSAAALLELDFEQPSLDYHGLMKLTKIITRSSADDAKEMFRRMCFNVFAHNRDDHTKNFTYLYREEDQVWRLAPAYDLTYSNTYFGEHTTSVDGNGKDPGEKELLAVGKKAGLGASFCRETVEQIRQTVQHCLHAYLEET